MAIFYIYVVLTFGWATVIVTQTSPQKLVEIPIKSYDEVYKISRLRITIVGACSTYVKAILSDKEIEEMKSLGYTPQIILEDYRVHSKKLLKLPGYHTYEEVINEMVNVANTYPAITLLDTIGYSIQGRLLLGLKISDSAGVHENEPGIRFTGCHHGNEHIATEIVLYMIHYLADNYSLVKELVDTREIWLIPMVNPDGVYYSTRENANGVDLNRDYGYMWEGWGSSPAPFSQIETKAMRKNALENRFVFGFDYHSVDYKVNTLWDYTPIYSQDDTIMMDIGKEYADSTGYQLIRGWYWYQVHGSCQDAMYGLEGILDYTIETPQPPDPTSVCEENRDAMLAMIKRAGEIGIAGIVTDSITGALLDARITLQEIRWPIYTDPRLGDYHRVLLPGIYSVKVSANGYLPKLIPGVIVSDSVTHLDVVLAPNGGTYAHRIVWANVADTNDAYTNHTLTADALGPPDGLFISIGVGGDIVVDMGENTIVTDSFTIYEGDDGTPNEGYKLLISNNWDGPFDSLGTYYGTHKFHIVGEARYVRIIDDGDGNSNNSYAGFDLDAIEAYSMIGICESKHNLLILYQNFPNPFSQKTVIEFRVESLELKDLQLQIYDLVGRLVKTFTIPNSQTPITEVVWDGRDRFGRRVSSGIYFCKLISGNFSRLRKITLVR